MSTPEDAWAVFVHPGTHHLLDRLLASIRVQLLVSPAQREVVFSPSELRELGGILRERNRPLPRPGPTVRRVRPVATPFSYCCEPWEPVASGLHLRDAVFLLRDSGDPAPTVHYCLRCAGWCALGASCRCGAPRPVEQLELP